MKKSLETLLTAIKDAQFMLQSALIQVDSVDPEIEGDWHVNLADSRSELSNASNAIDDAMGEIDVLLAPERTREETIDS